MTITLIVALNAIFAAAVVAALAYVCRVPYRLDRPVRLRETWAGEECEPVAYERTAA